jgi:hypothetical protein
MKRENVNISKTFFDEKKKEEEQVKNKTNAIPNPMIGKTESKQRIGNQDILQSIYSDGGSKEFKEKMGRNMTYEEMREMY